MALDRRAIQRRCSNESECSESASCVRLPVPWAGRTERLRRQARHAQRSSVDREGMFLSGPVKRTAFTFSPLEAKIEANVGHAVGTYDQRLVLPSGQTVSETGK